MNKAINIRIESGCIIAPFTDQKIENVYRIKICNQTGAMITKPIRSHPYINHAGIILGHVENNNTKQYVVCSLKNKKNVLNNTNFHIETIDKFSESGNVSILENPVKSTLFLYKQIGIINDYLAHANEYNILTNNCQTFAHHIFYGEPAALSNITWHFFLLLGVAGILSTIHIIQALC